MVGCVETDFIVSVIINVYNCKDYLPTSLGSVRHQTYKNLEVILVDDCSTDGSGEFCDEYCKQDERFRVIHHETNTGVSGPRNTGLKSAKGEYIYFMDSDDYIHERAIEKLVEAVEKTGCELAVFDLARTESLTEDTHRPLQNKDPQLIPTEQMVFEMLSRVELKWCVAWNKLYKRSLIDGIFFNDYYSIQDQDFNIRVYKKIDKVAFIPEALYWYYRNPNSLQRQESLYPKKFYFNTMYRFRMLDYLSKKDKKEKKYRAWVIGYGYLQILERFDIVKNSVYESGFMKFSKEFVGKYRWEFLFSRYITFVKKMKFVINWKFPSLYNRYVRIRYNG